MPEWVAQAKHLVETGQMTQIEVAELFGVTRQAVNHHLRDAKLRRRVANMTEAERTAHRAKQRERMRVYREQKKKGKQDAD